MKFISQFKLLSFYEILLLIVPFAQILGPTYLNIILISSSIFFLYELYKKRTLREIRFNWVFFFIIFYSYNIIRGFFASNSMHALQNSFSQIRFLFFALFIFFCIKTIKNIRFILNIWAVLILLVALDTLYQYYFSKDIFGYELQGEKGSIVRLGGPFDTSLRVGGYIAFLSIPIFFYYFKKFKILNILEKIFFLFFYFFVFLILSLIGERMVFLIFLFSSLVIFFFIMNLKKFIISLLLIIILLFSIYNFNTSFRLRFTDMKSISLNIYESSYGRLWESSFILFKNNKIFGVGLKNYRVNCDKQIDPRPQNEHQFCSTHPHNFILELLVETGIIGFILFFIFYYKLLLFLITKIKTLKNKLILEEYLGLFYGNILMILIYIFPFRTSGSFFTTWNASFFWLNLGIALLLTKKKII
jgi:hypothetical protein